MKTLKRMIAIVALSVALASAMTSCNLLDVAEDKTGSALFYHSSRWPGYAMVIIENVDTLFINNNFGQQVNCDNETDNLRLYNLKLPEGEYNVTIDFQTGRIFEKTINVRAGKCQHFDIYMVMQWDK